MALRFKHTAVGGTFDLLHKGHIALLEKAFSISKFVSIGITTDMMAQSADKIPYQNQKTRAKNLRQHLKRRGLTKRAKIIWLNDVFGPAPSDKTLDAIVVSKKTLKNAQEINKKRQKYHLKKIILIVVKEILSSDKKPISSTRIRNGEIDKNGLVYKSFLGKIAGQQISDRVRAALKKPFGKYTPISKSLKKADFAVGDITVKNFLKVGITPQISIVDLCVQRKRVFNDITDLGFKSANPDYIVKNVAGQISKDLIAKIETAIKVKRKVIILVDGEEDLAAIPAILLAPIGSAVVYGQPNRGATKVEVTTDAKNKLCKILEL